MKIGVIGLGYVGLVTGIVLASQGHKVIGIDIDAKKINLLNSGKVPIYEPGLEDLFAKSRNNLTFSTDYSLIKEAEVVFLAVPTPTVNDRIDLSYVFDAAKRVKEANSRAILVIKSTVIPGTAAKVHKETGMVVVSNPEFLREGSAVEDTLHPDRVVVGSEDPQAVEVVAGLWSFTNAPVVKTNNVNAELIKYASNSFLATKISFINELANLCEKIPGADVEIVAKGMGLDKRIAPYFLKAGIGYGGSCFPKDTKAIAALARDLGSPLRLVETTIQVNEERVEHVKNMVKEAARVGSKIGILGLAFKDNTDDLRESQAIKLIKKLQEEGFYIIAYDPIVKQIPVNVQMAPTKEECIKNADILVIAAEWPEFKQIKTEKPIIDARRILEPKDNVIPIGFGRTIRNDSRARIRH